MLSVFVFFTMRVEWRSFVSF